jgi:hypothetical protein
MAKIKRPQLGSKDRLLILVLSMALVGNLMWSFVLFNFQRSGSEAVDRNLQFTIEQVSRLNNQILHLKVCIDSGVKPCPIE